MISSNLWRQSKLIVIFLKLNYYSVDYNKLINILERLFIVKSKEKLEKNKQKVKKQLKP